jgi:hypothetical protein
MSEGLLQFLANLNGTISSILAAIIAFILAARTGLRGRGLHEIEKFYDKAVVALFVIFLASVVSLTYFLIKIYLISNLTFCHVDLYFGILLALILPVLAVSLFLVYKKY